MNENVTYRFSHDYTPGFCENNEADQFISAVMQLFGSILCPAMVKRSYQRSTFMAESPVLSCPVLPCPCDLHATRTAVFPAGGCLLIRSDYNLMLASVLCTI